MSEKFTMDRRQFLLKSAMAAAGLALTACAGQETAMPTEEEPEPDRKSTRLNSSHYS